MNLKIISGMSLIVFLICISPLLAETGWLHDWRFHKKVQLPEIAGSEGLVAFEADGEIFEITSPHMPDVRIVDTNSGNEVQYQLIVEGGGGIRQSLVTYVNDVMYLPNGDAILSLYLGEEVLYHNEIELVTSEDNFNRNVLVEGSLDGDIWIPLRENARIFDFTAEDSDFGVKETRISYPTNSFSYLRLTISKDGSHALQINGAKTYFTSETPLNEEKVNVDSVTKAENYEARETNWVFDLGARGIPTNRLDINSSRENFHRDISIEGSDNGDDWELVSSTDFIYSYSTPKFIGNKFSLEYPEAFYRFYKLKVLNENNDSLPISDFEFYGFVRRIVFYAHSDIEYNVYYGNDETSKPSYELDHVLRHVDTENLPLGKLGGQMENPGYSLPVEPFTERYTWFMPIVLSFTTIAIGLFLANVVRQIKGKLSPPEDGI